MARILFCNESNNNFAATYQLVRSKDKNQASEQGFPNQRQGISTTPDLLYFVCTIKMALQIKASVSHIKRSTRLPVQTGLKYSKCHHLKSNKSKSCSPPPPWISDVRHKLLSSKPILLFGCLSFFKRCISGCLSHFLSP